jgi:UDP-glucose 4-epimerase
MDRPALGALPPNVDEQIGDVTDPSAVHSAMQGVNSVIHLAVLLHIVNPPPEMREKYERVNVGGRISKLGS